MRPDSQIHWRAYPALGVALGIAAGIAGAAALGGSFWLWVAAAIFGLLAAVGVQMRRSRRLVTLRPLGALAGVALAVACLGGARYILDQRLPADHVAFHLAEAAGGEVVLRGRVAQDPVEGATSRRFELAADSLVTAEAAHVVQGLVQVTLGQSPWRDPIRYSTVERGDVVRLRGRLRPTPRRRNPADFDYGRYLRRRGLHATLAIYDSAGVVVIGRDRRGLDHVVAPARAYVRRQLARHVPTEASQGLLHALILGERGQIDAATRERFVQTGLMHLLAVSGLHVLLVGMVLYGVLRPVFGRLGLHWQAMEGARSTVTLAVLVLYMLVAGAGASVVRAVIMTALFIGATVLHRNAQPLNTLGVAAVALLLARPAHLFEPGFQLSFAAVAAIVTLHPRLTAHVPEPWMALPPLRHLVTSTSVSLAATLGTLPVLLYHFGHVSFAGLVLNLAAIPLTALTLGSGLVAVMLGGFWPFGAGVFGASADLLAGGLLGLVEVGEGMLGWAVVRAYVQNPWYVLALAAGLLMLAQWPRPRLRWRWAAASLGLGTAGLWLGLLGGAHRPGLDVLFFDVGHGDAALVAFPNGRHLLIDAGGRDAHSDRGTRTILPHLERFGITRLDAIVISHPHGDHQGGVPALLRAVPIGRVLHNGQPHASALYAETQHLLDSLAIPHRALVTGDTLALDASVAVHVLAPEAGTSGSNVNDASVVLQLRYGETTFLFTGDAEAAAERALVARFDTLLASDVIKVGHHGSRTSSTPAFVDHAAPDSARPALAVVSVGSPGLFDLPDEDVLARWHAHGADLWITHRRGALWLRTDGRRLERIDWR